ncbi:hypothetical protein [Paraburkholderia strydomiana]|uniref:hypothetical protein n=1 Tax=Paraburkholderia strydomiana TaxID=1245417 RepID=UPI001BE93B34|nr:hypothetical protein [Paraburkholderia strydomiana]
MRYFFVVVVRLSVLALFGILPGTARPANAPPPGTAESTYALPVIAPAPDASYALNALQNREDLIRQRASAATSDAQLLELDALSRRVAEDVDKLITGSLQPDLARTHAQLDVLGAMPAADTGSETPAVARTAVRHTEKATRGQHLAVEPKNRGGSRSEKWRTDRVKAIHLEKAHGIALSHGFMCTLHVA